jgi:hypothetical protein
VPQYRWRHSRDLQLRLSATNVLAEDALSASSVADVDGFTAGSESRRQTLAQFNASLVLRF